MRANCSICSDLFDGINTVITTPCGHVFHEICCLQWLENSHTCPACRQKIKHNSIVRLYFTIGGEDETATDNVEEKLRNDLETAKATVKLKDMEKRKLFIDIDDLRKAVIKAEDEAAVNHQKYLECQGQMTAMRLQMKHSLKEISLLQSVADDNKRLQNQLQHLRNVENIINDCQGDVDTMLSSCGGGDLNTKDAATYITLLKKQVQSSQETRKSQANELRSLKHDLGIKSSVLKGREKELRNLQGELSALREVLEALEKDAGPSNRVSPLNTSKRRFCSEEASPKENIPTPFKRPKINMVSAVANKLHDRPDVTSALPPQTTISMPSHSLFRKENLPAEEDSIIHEGYNGFGGHTKFVSRSAPLKMRFTNLPKKSTNSKKPAYTGPTIGKFLGLI